MLTYTYDLRRLISKKDMEGAIYSNLMNIRQQLIDYREIKKEQLNRLPAEKTGTETFLRVSASVFTKSDSFMEPLFEDHRIVTQREVLKASIRRLDYYINIFTEDTIRAFAEEQLQNKKEIEGKNHYEKALQLMQSNRKEAIKELRKAMMYGDKQATQTLMDTYARSDIEEERKMTVYIANRLFAKV